MSASLIVWLVVAGLLFIILVARIVAEYSNTKNGKDSDRERRFKIIELGREKDEFYIPGDATGIARYDDYDQYYN
ncbi:MAG: hypothetical protein K2F94_08915 [Muribaculaceae bacterium]|nr:hypothetical protein [Muribaculaceae bacterium]MDE6534325.1 hypothetical protein [Muribaculaceae bacterium]MDE6772914.1 hypothetical protein [Muribaculaceae bacterium]